MAFSTYYEMKKVKEIEESLLVIAKVVVEGHDSSYNNAIVVDP